MSKNKLLALALASALAAPSAFATSVTVGAAPGDWTILPQNVFNDPAYGAVNLRTLAIFADASSVYLGRTTGYNIRITLSEGTFDGNPTATPIGNTDSVLLAGGGNDFTTATFAVTPDPVLGVTSGDGIQFVPGNIVIDELTDISTGGVVAVAVQVFDPVGGNQLGTTLNANLIQTVQGWALTFNGPDGGLLGADQRIDVGTNDTFDSKTVFSPDGVVNSTSQTNLFSAGFIEVGLNPGMSSPWGLDPLVATSQIRVAGTNFDFLADAYLSLDPDCAGSTASATSIDTDEIVFPAVAVDTLNNHYLCFEADAATQIQNQDISATAGVVQAPFLPLAPQSDNDALLDLAYNGIVKIVSSFNPASNASVDSLLRVINTSSVGGLFTVEASCQDGTQLTPATFVLAAGNSVQYASAELESGDAAASKPALSNGLGSCSAGRLRLVVTGEVGTAEVQNFLRANTSVGVITSGHNNQD